MPQGNTKRKQATDLQIGPRVQRGSLITLKRPLVKGSNLAVVVSNDIQNSNSDYILVVPLQRRASRLRAPFAVDLGRSDGLRDLHSARCDWVTRIQQKQVKTLERASFPNRVMKRFEEALSVALGFSDVI